MRLISSCLVPIVLVAGLVDAAAAVKVIPAPKSCPNADPARPVRVLPSRANALDLLGSVTQLLAPRGRPVLDSNFATTLAINNRATPPLRAQALEDAQITDENAFVLADGLGVTMGGAYRRKAFYRSVDDGRTVEIGEIGPAVSALIKLANATSAGDSAEGKCAFASGVEPYQGGRWTPPAGGTLDVLGKAYGRPAGSPGADPFGNSRPFQTAPIGAAAGPRIETWDGKDFFGVATNSRLALTGATPSDRAAGRTGSDLTENPAYPSGHTTFGYTQALLLAMMVPERYRALAFRGSEYGHSRIVIGAHYTLDVIAGRTLATYDLAQGLAGRPGYPRGLRAALAAAAVELRTYLTANGCPSIAACAREPIVRSENADVVAAGAPRGAPPAAAYRFRLTYGLAPLAPPDAAPEPVPAEAAALLETRFPYLTLEQRRDILRTTEGPSGHFLDIDPVKGSLLSLGKGDASTEAGVYSRLNLFAAAGGYGRFDRDIVVDQEVATVTEPDLRPFADLARTDVWSNDIDGPGGLTKRGSGTLTLTGANTYVGPTIVEGGTLEVTGSTRSSIHIAKGGTLAGIGRLNDVSVATGGSIAAGARDGAFDSHAGPLRLDGSLDMSPGSAFLVLEAPNDDGAARVGGRARIDGARLVITSRTAPQSGRRYRLLIAAGGISGRFFEVASSDPALSPKLSYEADAVYLTMERRQLGRAP